VPPQTHDGQLADVRVLDLGIWRPAPYAAQLLADLGADVIKVEPPGGDPMRVFGELFASLTAHKRPVVIDLKEPEGLRRVLDLAREADVVLEGFRPGVAERLGVGPDAVHALNPKAVYCSISGYGREGPLSQLPGHDINYQALSGLLASMGSAVEVPKIPLADLAAGLAAAFAICAALVRAQRTGRGEVIDVAMADVLATWTGAIETHTIDGTAAAEGNPRGTAGYSVYDTADGQVVVGIVTEDGFWRSLCDVLALAHLRDVGAAERMARSEELDRAVAARLAQRPRDEVVDLLASVGVPVSPVLSRSEVLGLSHFRDRRIVHGDVMGHPVTYLQAPARPPMPPVEPASAADVRWITAEGS
jgi:crotonobetainyl-CoA:carnitine CoA-transferase CaiB-like acyl-CoA transferase